MRVRRALGALLTVFVFAPLPALCEVCATGHCPPPAPDPPMEDHCRTGFDGTTADPSRALVDADCCVGPADVAAATPGVPAQAPAGPTVTPLAEVAVPNPAPALSSELRPSEAPPPESPAPLYRLYSCLLI